MGQLRDILYRPFPFPSRTIVLFQILIWIFATEKLFGWLDHKRLTQHALAELRLPRVSYQPLREPAKCIRELQIKPNYSFPNKMGEGIGGMYSIAQILATYSEEPDWGIDQELFDAYPDLWKKDYAFIGGRKGLASQGFRHMFFPGWSIHAPWLSFQIPFHAVGEGPKQAQRFLFLSKNFFERGETYWGYRFLAWGLHYLQDLFQPFHTTQVPLKRWIRFKLKPPFLDIARTQDRLAAFHLLYERWVAERWKPSSEKIPVQNTLSIAEVVSFSHLKSKELGAILNRTFQVPEKIDNVEEWVKNYRFEEEEKPELKAITDLLLQQMFKTTEETVRSFLI